VDRLVRWVVDQLHVWLLQQPWLLLPPLLLALVLACSLSWDVLLAWLLYIQLLFSR